MKRSFSSIGILIGCLALSAFVLSHCASPRGSTPASEPFDPIFPRQVPETVIFERDLKPLLEIECVQCHNHKDAGSNAGLNLETRHAAMTTGLHAPAIRPGDPDNSLFVQVLESDVDHPTSMPPAPDKIWGVRLAIIRKWIRDGAVWPDHVRMVRPQDWAR